MDRSDLDDIVLTCPNYQPILVALYAVAIVVSLRLVWQVLSSICFQKEIAHKMGSTSVHAERLAIFSLSSALSTIMAVVAFSTMKIFFPELLLGVHVLPALLVSVRNLGINLTANFNALRSNLMALEAQARSTGRTRVDEAIGAQTRKTVLRTLFVSFGVTLPMLVGTSLSAIGVVTSTRTYTLLLFVYTLTDAVSMVSGTIVGLFQSRKLRASFQLSIDAVKAALIVAEGGASRVENLSQASPNYRLSRLDTLEAAHSEVGRLRLELQQLRKATLHLRRRHRWTMTVLGVAMPGLVFFVAIPHLWSKVSYRTALFNIAFLILARQSVRQYTRYAYRQDNAVQRV